VIFTDFAFHQIFQEQELKENEMGKRKSHRMREGRKKCVKTFVEISDGNVPFD
jgi:hypothetical protein